VYYYASVTRHNSLWTVLKLRESFFDCDQQWVLPENGQVLCTEPSHVSSITFDWLQWQIGDKVGHEVYLVRLRPCLVHLWGRG